jgi:uncharacterized protein (DUF885 family)
MTSFEGTTMNADNMFETLTKELLDRFFEHNPHWASHIGLHDPYDYQLPKGNTAHVLENHRLLETYVNRMSDTIEYQELTDAHKIDWHVLTRALERSHFEITEQRQHELNPNAFDDIGSVFFMMITRDYAPLAKRIDAIIARIEQLPQYLIEFQSRFAHTQPVKLWTDIAIETAQQIPGLFQFITSTTKEQIPEDLHQRLQHVVEQITQPLQDHMTWLNSLQSNTIDQWALGPARFEQLIQLRGLNMTSEDILDIGIKYLNELKEERAQLAAQYAPGHSVEDAMKLIEANAPQTFEDALQTTRDTMMDAKQFVITHKIATVHDEDKLLVEETPAFLTHLIPFAALFVPSRFDTPMIGVYILTRPKDLANLGNHFNYATLRNVAVHEAFPGHFLQGTISNRSSLVHLFAQGMETVEGWAHYCEEMMMEHGFMTGVESKLIQVNDAIWRAVRIIVDVKLSRGEMTFDDAVNMLVTEVGMSQEGATAEVRWYTQSPGYPLSYLMGKHLILQLRDDIKQKMGSTYSETVFHDTITANGNLPIALLRTVFNQKLAR